MWTLFWISFKKGNKINSTVWLWCLYSLNQSTPDFIVYEKVVYLHWNSYLHSTKALLLLRDSSLLEKYKFLPFWSEIDNPEAPWWMTKNPLLKRLISQPLLLPAKINGHSKRTVECLLSKVDWLVLNFCGSLSFVGKTLRYFIECLHIILYLF